MEKKIRHIVVGHEYIRKTVVIIIRESEAHAASSKRSDPGFFRNVFECSVAAIAIERARQSVEIFRMTINADLARRIAAESAISGRSHGPIRVMNHPQVEQSVVVVIEPSGGDGPFAAADPGLRRHIFEPAIAEIVVEKVAIDTGHE